MTSGMRPKKCALLLLCLWRAQEKAMMSLQLPGGTLQSLNKGTQAHMGGHAAVSSTLLGSEAPRSTRETNRHTASLEGTLGTLGTLKIINETKDDYIQIECLCK